MDWAEGVALLVVVTARPELYAHAPAWGGGKRNATTLALRPLADAETAQLLAALLDAAVLPAEAQAALLERAGGNPLYAEQFVRLISEQGLLTRRGRVVELSRREDLPLPDTVTALIAARLDTLAAGHKQLLADAAVLGRVFWSGGLLALGERDAAEVRIALRDLARAELVRRVPNSTVDRPGRVRVLARPGARCGLRVTAPQGAGGPAPGRRPVARAARRGPGRRPRRAARPPLPDRTRAHPRGRGPGRRRRARGAGRPVPGDGRGPLDGPRPERRGGPI